MNDFKIDSILKITEIQNEFELAQASAMFNKLRLLMKEDASLKPLRKHLADLIEKYEAANWSDSSGITDEQIRESDQAEKLVAFQNDFIQRRKSFIKDALKKKDLLQNDLAKILGHRKNYMSELMNGARPFSQEDIVIINRVLSIRFEDLIVPVLKEQTARRIRNVIELINKPALKLEMNYFNVKLQ